MRQIPESFPPNPRQQGLVCTIIAYHIMYYRIARETRQTFKSGLPGFVIGQHVQKKRKKKGERLGEAAMVAKPVW
jgi:hypothetical protein